MNRYFGPVDVDCPNCGGLGQLMKDGPYNRTSPEPDFRDCPFCQGLGAVDPDRAKEHDPQADYDLENQLRLAEYQIG